MTKDNGKVVSFPDGAPTVDDVRKSVRAKIEAEGLSKSAVAREAGVSQSAFSEFLSGTYEGRNDRLARQLKKWLRRSEETKQLRGVRLTGVPYYIETPTARRIFNGLGYAQSMGNVSVIYGGAGLSKTTTIRHYAERNPNVWVVTATPATATVAVILQEIAYALDMRDFPLHPATLQRKIVQRIQGTGGLLVIDEAQNLKKPALEQIRALHDATGIGLALAGNADVYGRIYGGGHNGFAQLFSRVGRRVELVKPLVSDVHAIAAAYGIDDRATQTICEQIARQHGALRYLVQACRLASTMVGDGAITADRLQVAAADLKGDDDSDGGDYV